MDRITMLLGGRAAEHSNHDISTGASNDIRRAAISQNTVTEWGMSSLGNIYLGGAARCFSARIFKQHNYSERAGKIDEEVKIIIDESYKQTKRNSQ